MPWKTVRQLQASSGMRRLAIFTAVLLIAGACRHNRKQSDLEYWEQRAKEHGARSVLNLGHSAAQMDEVTRKQVETLFPILRRHLTGNEQLILDFGSGSGRFTPALAELIGGPAIGVDPIQRLLDLSPRAPNVEYRLLPADGTIPLEDGSVDVVWISLVLGAITDDDALRKAVLEVERVLEPGGLLFLVENTAEKEDLEHFEFRPIAEYASMFPSIPLAHQGDYEDLGERISIFAGRKRW